MADSLGNHPLHLAVIGAGPVGLTLALQAAYSLPDIRISVFDARLSDHPVALDPRTIALSLGSIQILERLNCWDTIISQGQVADIKAVHVSQQQPTLLPELFSQMAPLALRRWLQARQSATHWEPHVHIESLEAGMTRLGAVLSYGDLVAPLQAAWLALAQQFPERFMTRFNTRVGGIKGCGDTVEIDTQIVESYDLAVIAEGGVFADQAPKQWPAGFSRDYQQTAWVGTVVLQKPHQGIAYERFTPSGPVALLPLPAARDSAHARASLVWCVPSADDPLLALTPQQRLALLKTLVPPDVGELLELAPLKAFPLGLNVTRRLVDGRSIRIGNAAQTLHPVAGQGLNLGLRDASDLVRMLADEPLLAHALRRFERRRLPDRMALIGTTDFLARSFTWPLPILSTLRGLGLAAIENSGPLKSQLARRMMFGIR